MAVNPILRPIFNLSRRLRPVSVNSVRFGSTVEDPNILKSPFGTIDIPDTNITDFLFERTSKWGHLISTVSILLTKPFKTIVNLLLTSKVSRTTQRRNFEISTLDAK